MTGNWLWERTLKNNWTKSGRRLLLALALAAVTPAHAQDEKLAADTPRTTSAGATFMAPAGWTISQSANVVVLTPPEDDSKLALVDVEAKDADSAVAAAWAAFRPGFKPPARARHAAGAARRLGRAPRLRLRNLAQRKTRGLRHRVAGGNGVDRGARGRLVGNARQAARAFRPGDREPAAQGLRAREFRREESPSARRQTHRRDARIRRELDERAPGPRRGVQPDRRRQGRLRGRPRREAAGQAGEGRRRHALHGRFQHQGADHAAAWPSWSTKTSCAGTSRSPRRCPPSGSATPTPRARSSSSISCAPAPACRARTWSGCSSSAAPRPPPPSRCSAACSPPAASARSTSTAIRWPRPRAMLPRM